LTTQNSIATHMIPVIRVYNAGGNVIDSRHEKFTSIHPPGSAASTFCRSHVDSWISCIGICSNGGRALEERAWLSGLPGNFRCHSHDTSSDSSAGGWGSKRVAED